MRIYFCRHAEAKFEILREHGFPITKKQIKETLESPDKVERSIKGRKVAQKRISEWHVLRVIFEKEGAKITVITFYPGRREYYED